MDNRNHHASKPYVAVPHDVFDRLRNTKNRIEITGLDVVEAFTLYFVLLLRMDWKREAEIQMNRLIERYFGKARSETYMSINRYLLMLKTAELIDYSGNRYTGKDIICANIVPIGRKYSLIACVNEYIITCSEIKRSNAPFALHSLLNIKRVHKDDIWSPVEISQEKLADYLSINRDTVRDSIDWLSKCGYIRRTLPQYYTASDGNVKSQCLLYTVHDYDSPVDNTNIIDGIERQKAARHSKKIDVGELKRLFQDSSHTPILLIGEYSKVIDGLRQADKEIGHKLYNVTEIETTDEVEDFTAQYYGKKPGNDTFIIITLPSNRLAVKIQEKFLKFIEDNDKLPIIILSEHDCITASFLSRMKNCLKKSTVKARSIKFEPLHKGYLSYENKHKYFSYNGMIGHALNNCPELLPPIVTNPDGNTALCRLDKLISQLTGGKTYTDVLSMESDATTDIPTETKYLSLSLRRADLARLTIEEYEAAIDHDIQGATRR